MSWVSISDLVLEALPVARRAPEGLAMREAAGLIAVQQWGQRVTQPGMAALVNVAALAYAGRKRLQVHHVRPAAARLVAETDLHSLPAEAPQLLRGPWLLEARRPETGEVLFGTTVGLGGYPLESGALLLVGIHYPDGVAVAQWRPKWSEGELPAGGIYDASELMQDVDAKALGEWAAEAARFALVFGLLLDAEDAPLRISDERSRDAQRRGDGGAGMSVRHVYLDERRVSRGPGDGQGPAVDTSGRIAQPVMVRGHLKRQLLKSAPPVTLDAGAPAAPTVQKAMLHSPSPAHHRPAPFAPAPANSTCCKHCSSRSQPCGDTCIPLNRTCHVGPGCAC